MTLKLIHFPMTRSLRVAWAICELGIDAEIETRPFDRARLKEPEYLALNPLGKTPVFFDGDRRMIESVAIIEYLAQTYAKGALSRPCRARRAMRSMRTIFSGCSSARPAWAAM